jgi:hypothetical protein
VTQKVESNAALVTVTINNRAIEGTGRRAATAFRGRKTAGVVLELERGGIRKTTAIAATGQCIPRHDAAHIAGQIRM